MKSSLLSKFLILNRSRARANVYSEYGKDLNGSAAITFHETRCVQKRKITVCFVGCQDLILFF